MKSILFVAGFLLFTISSSLLMGQDTSTSRSINMKAMYEDIEIGRRILFNHLNRRPIATRNTETSSVTETDVELSGLEQAVSDPSPEESKIAEYENAVKQGLHWLASNQPPSKAQTSDWQNSYRRTLLDLYGTVPSTADRKVLENWIGGGSMISIDGNYLKRHGVVYTGTIMGPAGLVILKRGQFGTYPQVCSGCHQSSPEPKKTESPKSKETPLSEWDRTRQDLLGTKEEPKRYYHRIQNVQSICAPGSLIEQVLDILGENGHRFRELPANENITVIFTLNPNVLKKTVSNSYFNIRYSQMKSDVSTFLTAAELHIKQKNPKVASDSLQKAIQTIEGFAWEVTADTPYEEVAKALDDSNVQLRDVYRRYATTLVEAGKTQEAKAVLDKGTITLKLKNQSPEKTTRQVSLPMKLSISVSKKSMDDFHAKKINVEQFRKSAEIEAINFPAMKK